MYLYVCINDLIVPFGHFRFRRKIKRLPEFSFGFGEYVNKNYLYLLVNMLIIIIVVAKLLLSLLLLLLLLLSKFVSKSDY